jgi:hypothetical protein
MSAIKRSIFVVKEVKLYLAHALVLAMAKVNNDPNYVSCTEGRKLKKPAQDLLLASGVQLDNEGGIEELAQIQNFLPGYKIIVYDGLSPNRVMFSRNTDFPNKLNLLHDSENKNYDIITNITGAMAKRHTCNGCDMLCDYTHKCDKVCLLCSTVPPCSKSGTKYCKHCNKIFLKEECYWNRETSRENCVNVCSQIITSDLKHECFKWFCSICNKNQPSGHFRYMSPLNPARLSSNTHMYSLILSVLKTLKRLLGVLTTYQILYVFSRCALCAKLVLT